MTSKEITTLAQEKSSKSFITASNVEAACVLKEMFSNAKESIVMYDDGLNGSILDEHPEMYAAMKAFFTRGGKWNLVISPKEEVHQSAKRNRYKRIVEERTLWAAQFSMHVATEEFVKELRRELGDEYYFYIADGHMFRLERTRVPPNRLARNSFNQEDTVKALRSLWDKAYSHVRNSPEVTLANYEQLV